MARRDPFEAALADADAMLAERELASRVDERIAASVHNDAAAPRRTWLLAALVPVVAVLLFVVLGRGEGPPPAAQVSTIDGWAIRSPSEGLDVRRDGKGIRVLSGTARFEDPAFGAVSNAGPVAFERARDGVRLIEGEATFSVTHDTEWTRPKRVVVSHGAIEIIGTRFTVDQTADGGTVVLHEGTIRFVDEEGAVTLSVGERLRWPRVKERDDASDPAPAPTTSASAPPTPPAAVSASSDPRELMRKVEELRSRGRYDEAAELLRKVEGVRGDGATRERLSFERGSLLTYQRKDRARACAHWIRHLEQYPHGRYGDDVHRALQHLKCGSHEGKDP